MSLHRFLSRSLIFSSAGGRSVLRSTSAAFSTEPTSRTRKPRSSLRTTPHRETDGESLLRMPEKKELRRPSEVPFQPQVANSVHLIGNVAAPVQIKLLPDGTTCAISSLVCKQTMNVSSEIWIPVVFHGDLADIAAFYLSENDLVYVTGQLSGDAPLSSVKGEQINIQILAHTLCYVQEASWKAGGEGFVLQKQVGVASKSSGEVEEPSIQKEWADLLANPHKWLDNRLNKDIPTSIDFKHISSGQSLRVDELTPEMVRSKLDLLAFCSASGTSWSNLVCNPEKWRDYRTDKEHGSVKPNYPDFKHMDSGSPLWLNKAPAWVLEQLDSLEFSGGIRIKQDTSTKNTNANHTIFPSASLRRESTKSDCNIPPTARNKKALKLNLWESLAEDPSKWWDNRLKKLKKTSPDFKHKETGDALWIDNSTPSSILEKLPRVE